MADAKQKLDKAAICLWRTSCRSAKAASK